MRRRPPRPTRSDTPFPSTTLFRSVSTGTVVDAATRLADADGLAAVTIRRLASELEVSTMSVYTHVNSRDDLLVLMADAAHAGMDRSEEHTSELQSLMRNSYAVFCLKKTKKITF